MTLTRRQTFLLAALEYCRASAEGGPAGQRMDAATAAHAQLMAAWRDLPPDDRAMNPPGQDRDGNDSEQPWWKKGQYG